MKERYIHTSTKKNSSGKSVYNTTINPEIPKRLGDIYFISTMGDRLDLYANEYFGDTRYWPVIAQANHIGKGSVMVPAVMQIRIPSLTKGELDTLLKNMQNER